MMITNDESYVHQLDEHDMMIRGKEMQINSKMQRAMCKNIRNVNTCAQVTSNYKFAITRYKVTLLLLGMVMEYKYQREKYMMWGTLSKIFMPKLLTRLCTHISF